MVKDMHGKEIQVGDIVNVFGLIGVENRNHKHFVGSGKVKSLSGMHGSPDRAMVWTKGISSCYSPESVELRIRMSDKHFTCKLKTRKQMDEAFGEDPLGWYYDVCHGDTLKLKQATQADLERCIGTKGKNPDGYMVEIFERGCLVDKRAIKKMTEIEHESTK